MDSDTTTLAFLLCMHRSGSSLTASVFQELGMSLGPYPLVGAHSSNIHGHFESLPLLMLNKKVQEIAFGFPEDFPKSEEVLTRFLDGKGIWPEGVKIPDELFDESRRLVAGLIGSGGISGFKDPRTVLTWPFWRQVLQEFHSLRVVVVPLLRSPHEIAMSLCTRSDGALGYWASLDLIAVHFGRMKAILENENQATRAIGFGSESFLDDLAEAARFCGLSWNKEDALRVFDRTCVHHEPATVVHEAQMLYEELGGQRPPLGQAERNRWLLARDARKCEALTQRLVSQRQSEAQQQLSQARDELARAQASLSVSRDQLARAREEMSRAQESERRMWEECQRLREQRDRFESHPVLGQVLRARRRVKGLLARSAVGSEAE
ncbi:MAG: hypothetical protein ABSH35_07010 [Isosphaeraceae bacterium]|jgi:hypothetical protein